MFRFMSTGVMPNSEGEVEDEFIAKTPEEQDRLPTYSRAAVLFGTGIGLYFLHIAPSLLPLCFCRKKIQDKKKPLVAAEPDKDAEQIRVVAGMIFAWCLFFSLNWLTDLYLINRWGMEAGEESTATISAVIVATFITFFGYGS